MKKILLSVSTLVLALTANAQMSANGDGFTINNKDAASNCLINVGLPNNGGIMNGDQSTFQTMQLTANGLTLTSKSDVGQFGTAAWFQIHSVVPGIIGDGSDDVCSKLFSQSKGVNLTNQTKVGIKVSSSVAPATLELFLGGEGEWGPSSSTFSADLVATIQITEANKQDTYVIDFAALDADKWGNFAGKNKVQSVGYRSATADAVFTVEQVLLGSMSPANSSNAAVAKSLNVYPNPASNVLTVEVDAVAASSVELVDLSGKLVATQSVGAGFNKVQFNVANVNAGLYFLSVRSANGVVTQKVIVK